MRAVGFMEKGSRAVFGSVPLDTECDLPLRRSCGVERESSGSYSRSKFVSGGANVRLDKQTGMERFSPRPSSYRSHFTEMISGLWKPGSACL